MLNPQLLRQNVLFFLHRHRWLGVIAVMGVAVLLFCQVFTAHTPIIATVDVTGIIRQFVRSQTKLNLPAKTLEERVHTFGHALEGILNTIAKERHVVLVPKEAVIAGTLDLTLLVKNRLESQAPSTCANALW